MIYIENNKASTFFAPHGCRERKGESKEKTLRFYSSTANLVNNNPILELVTYDVSTEKSVYRFDNLDLSKLPSQGEVILTINNKDIQLLYVGELTPQALLKEKDNPQKYDVYKLKSYNG